MSTSDFVEMQKEKPILCKFHFVIFPARTMANENTFDMKIAPPYFQWVIDDKLAAFAFPSKAHHIAYLLENNIRTLISLQTYPDPPVSEFKDVEWHKISVREFHPPTVAQMCRFVEIVDTAIAKGQAVGVHCTFGRGRTGTMIAAYFVRSLGMSAHEAIAKIRRIRPWSIETQEQEEAVRLYEEHLQKSKSA